MKGDLGGLDKAVADFLKKLGRAEADAEKEVAKIVGPTGPTGAGGIAGGMEGVNVAVSSLSKVEGIFIDSVSDIAKVIAYLNDRILAANKFANEAAIAGRTTEAMGAIRDFLFPQVQTAKPSKVSDVAAALTPVQISDSVLKQCLCFPAHTLPCTRKD